MATLYVTEQGTQVYKTGERILLRKDEQILDDIPLIKLERVVIMGKGVSVTTPAMTALVQRQIDVLYLTQRGRFVSRVVGREHKHSKLRHMQGLAVADADHSLRIARSIVAGKIHNQRVLIQRHTNQERWALQANQYMTDMLNRTPSAASLDEARGLEGFAARAYFGALRQMLKPPREGGSWQFDQRAYYPPPDPVNAILSFGYTMLLHDLIAACQLAGLDPDLGFFHAVDYGKPAMALDLEEEFRPIVVDSIVLAAVNTPLLGMTDFESRPRNQGENGQPGVFLRPEARKRFIQLYETRVNERIQYLPVGGTLPYRQVMAQQAYAMARAILNNEPYQPFVVR